MRDTKTVKIKTNKSRGLQLLAYVLHRGIKYDSKPCPDGEHFIFTITGTPWQIDEARKFYIETEKINEQIVYLD